MTLEQRERVVAEARSWLGTPYHHQGRVKGAGVDCAMLPLLVYQAVGLVPLNAPFDDYPRDWYQHQDGERYLAVVERYADQVTAPRPGDLALFRWGRCVSHGAVVVAWPLVIHAFVKQGVTLADVATEQRLAQRYVGTWSLR